MIPTSTNQRIDARAIPNCLHTIITVSFFVLAGGATGCKPKADQASDVRSLDNFTRRDGADVTSNICGPPATDASKLKSSKVYESRNKMIFAPGPVKDEILATLAAVPDPIQAAFFGVGGSIQAAPDIKSKCIFGKSSEKEFAGENLSELTSCWRKKSDGTPPVIFVVSRPDAIRHGLVRSFSYIYTQLFVDSAAKLNESLPAGEKKKVLSAALKRFDSQKKFLVEGLLSDAAGLGKDVVGCLQSQRLKNQDQFADFVMAESLDSFYCSRESNAKMQKRFKNTFKAMTRGGLLNESDAPSNGLAFDLGRPWYY